MAHYTYMLRCSDNSIYTGYAADWRKRVEKHFTHEGAKYTKSHEALRLEAVFASPSKEDAMRLEYRLKQLRKAQKESLISEEEPADCRKTGSEENTASAENALSAGGIPEKSQSLFNRFMGEKLDAGLYERVTQVEIEAFNLEMKILAAERRA